LSGGGEWSLIPDWNIAAPECIQTSWTRDNHLGNTVNGQMFNYNWTIPNDVNQNCALRIRYNITTGDYNGWTTDSTSNTKNSPIYENPDVDIGAGTNLTLNINTNQFGRTFQDRSFQFEIRARPSKISAAAKIYNLGVRGKRGNIVEVYPAVEYDFVPNRLHVSRGDYIHIQWTGSDFNPTGNEGNGLAGTDRSNMVQIQDLTKNLPLYGSNMPQGIIAASSFFGTQAQRNLFATLGQNDTELDNAATPYFDGGLIQMNSDGSFYYMCTRNNDFSNRSQKGAIYVTGNALQLIAFSWIAIIALFFHAFL